MPYIAATSKGFPPYYYSQQEITAAICKLWGDNPGRLKRLGQFHENVQVEGRYLARPIESYTEPSGFRERNDTWIETALKLGEQTICQLLDESGLDPQDISQIVFTTITGVAAPSIDARLMNRIPFSPHLKRVPLFGLGCLGGAAGIARLADYLRGHPDQAAILLAVELCSLTIQHQDISVANLISSGLFGDGAAAVLMVGDEHPLARELPRPQVIDNRSVFFPETEHIMGWDIQDGGFKVLLSADLSEVIETHLEPVIAEFLAVHDLVLEDIAHWITHPGGPKVMQAIERSLDLDENALQLSRESLADVGNISSVSVLLILDETLARYQPEPGTYGLLMAMGPAFCAELVLLRW